MQLESPTADAYLDYLTAGGAHAATMAACALTVLEDTTPLPVDVSADLVTADYWYHVGRRTAFATAVCELVTCSYNDALSLFLTAMPCDTDPTDRHLPADGAEQLLEDPT